MEEWRSRRLWRGEEGKEEGRFWIFHKDPTRYSLPYENDTLPSLPLSLPPPFLLFRSNQIRGSRGTKEWTRSFPRPWRRGSTLCSRHFIGPSIINFRSGEICFSEELFLRSNPYLSYLEFYSYAPWRFISWKNLFPNREEPSLFKISRGVSRGFRLFSPSSPPSLWLFVAQQHSIKMFNKSRNQEWLERWGKILPPPFFWSSLSSKWE